MKDLNNSKAIVSLVKEEKMRKRYPSQYKMLRLVAKFSTCRVALIGFYKTAQAGKETNTFLTNEKLQAVEKFFGVKSWNNHIL